MNELFNNFNDIAWRREVLLLYNNNIYFFKFNKSDFMKQIWNNILFVEDYKNGHG